MKKCIKLMFLIKNAKSGQSKSYRAYHGDTENVVDEVDKLVLSNGTSILLKTCLVDRIMITQTHRC